MQKLHLALDVYRGLGVMPATRADTLAKVTSMLLHPFPKVCVFLVEGDVYVLIVRQVRITAAETLWFLTHEDGLKRHDWSLPSKSLKPAVDGIKATLTAMVTS
jgi:hypothetical protein